jgi:DNA-binding transcriptional MerR regulator
MRLYRDAERNYLLFMTRTFGIAELAEAFGITTRTIRFYEDQGLISPRREGQKRIYRPRDRVRLKLIMRGKRLGFSLDEIREMIDIYDLDRSEVAQLRLVLDKIRDRRAVLMQQRRDIDSMLGELDDLQERCAGLLAEKERSAAATDTAAG